MCPSEPQILADYSGLEKEDLGSTDAKQKVEWERLLEKVLREHSQSGDQLEIKKNKLRFLSNMRYLRGLDHSLVSGIGVGLGACVMPAPLLDRCPLTHQRKLQDIGAGGQISHQMVLEDLSDGSCRRELPEQIPMSLHVVIDQGSIGWPAAFYMCTDLNLFASFTLDPAHRCWNDARAAAMKADLGKVIDAGKVVFNIARGPWRKGAHLQMIKASAEKARRVCGIDDDLFCLMFERLSCDLAPSSNFGSREHMQEVMHLLKTHPCTEQVGKSLKECRWFSFFDRASEFLPSWNVLLFHLNFMLLDSGVFNSTSQLPIFSDGLQPLQPVGGDSDRKVDAVQSQDGKFKSQMGLAASILSSNITRNLLAMMAAVVEPTRLAHGMMLKESRSADECRMYLVRMAACDWEQELLQTWALLRDSKVLGS